MSLYQFKRDGDNIHLIGVDLSGKVKRIHTADNYEVWHVSGGSCWESVGQQIYSPAFLIVVRIGLHYFPISKEAGTVAFVIEERDTGKMWRKDRAEAAKLCDELSAKWRESHYNPSILADDDGWTYDCVPSHWGSLNKKYIQENLSAIDNVERLWHNGERDDSALELIQVNFLNDEPIVILCTNGDPIIQVRSEAESEPWWTSNEAFCTF